MIVSLCIGVPLSVAALFKLFRSITRHFGWNIPCRPHTSAPQPLNVATIQTAASCGNSNVAVRQTHSAHTFDPGNLENEDEDIDHVYSGNSLRVKIRTPEHS